MARKRIKRRQQHGSAWRWEQTNSWYYTLPGTRKRILLVDEDGQGIRGKENKKAAELALARVKLAGEGNENSPATPQDEWLVAKVCSEYIQQCERAFANGTGSESHRNSVVAYLNDLCSFCGALGVSELMKGHIKTWIGRHTTWRSPATHRHVIAIVLAAFNYADDMFGVANPIKNYKKPRAQPRLYSFSKEDEETIYANSDEVFGDFIFAGIHTGLRPFCELAQLTTDMVIETPRGMMWRIYSSKTKKTRKIPVFAEVADLSRRLMRAAPNGSSIPLFRNARGTPWKRIAGVMRFLKLKKKLKWDHDPIKKHYACYTTRHTFVHRMLSGYWNNGVGCSVETLAELIGDTPKTCFDHYGREWGQHYQEPLWIAVGNGKKKAAS